MTQSGAPNFEQYLNQVIDIAVEAGSILTHVFNQAASGKNDLGIEINLNIEIKEDNSPVTLADKLSSSYIEGKLRVLNSIYPVVTEENSTEFDTQANPTFWAVDPLDGTREFINNTGGHSVKIALIHNNEPVLGVIFCPKQNTLYYSADNGPSFKKEGKNAPVIMKAKPVADDNHTLRTLFNKAHANYDIYKSQVDRLKDMGVHLPKAPNATPGLPRNMQVAEGTVDAHVQTGRDATLRGSGGFIWDNGADHIIAKNAGAEILSLVDGGPLQYSDVRARQNAYITVGDKALAAKIKAALTPNN
jgi:3'(2'), 5'-bisphosphate nucleotidase